MSTLKVTVDVTVSIPAGGKTLITLPGTTSIVQSNTLTCAFAQVTSVTPTCSSSGQVVTVTMSGSITGIFQINVEGFTNAPYDGATPTFQVVTQAADGTQLEAKTTQIFLYVSHGQLHVATIVPTNPTVGVVSDATVTLTPGHLLQQNSLIRISFPIWNLDAPSYLREQFIVTSTPQCSALAGSSLSAGFTCTYDTLALTLTISNGVSGGDVAAGTMLNFTLHGLRTPLSTAPSASTITAKTETVDGRTIDQRTISITAGTAQTISSTTTTSDVTTVQDLGKFRLQFASPVPLETGCLITITLPSELAVTGNLATVIGMSLFGASRGLTFTKNLQLNQLVVLDGCNGYKNNDLDAILFFETIKNPTSTQPTGGITITIHDSSQYLIAQTSGAIGSYTATAGPVPSMSASVLSNVVNQQTSLVFNFKP